MIKNIDDKDYAIINILKKDAKLSTQQIARKTGIPITTVHNRVKKLKTNAIIKNYTITLNDELIGNVVAFVLISFMYRTADGRTTDQEELAKKISKNENVEEVNIIAGSSDLIVKVRAKNVNELNNFVVRYLRTIQGIEKTETLVVLKSV